MPEAFTLAILNVLKIVYWCSEYKMEQVHIIFMPPRIAAALPQNKSPSQKVHLLNTNRFRQPMKCLLWKAQAGVTVPKQESRTKHHLHGKVKGDAAQKLDEEVTAQRDMPSLLGKLPTQYTVSVKDIVFSIRNVKTTNLPLPSVGVHRENWTERSCCQIETYRILRLPVYSYLIVKWIQTLLHEWRVVRNYFRK